MTSVYFFESTSPNHIHEFVIIKNGLSSHTQEEIDELLASKHHRLKDEDTSLYFFIEEQCILTNCHPIEPKIVMYDHRWAYGGPEEGGWYYSDYTNPRVVDKHVDNTGLYRHQMTQQTFDEYVPGENVTPDSDKFYH